MNHSIAAEKDPNKKARLENERDSLKLQIAGIPIERKRLQYLSEDLGTLMSFLGKKELDLNKDLAVYRQALVIKLNLFEMTPYLKGMQLGGIRILHDANDGPHGENYFSVDINADIPGKVVVPPRSQVKRVGLRNPPSAVIRMNQAIFETPTVVKMESQSLQSKITDLKFELKDERLVASGKYHWFLFSIPFKTSIAVKYSDIDQFLVGVNAIKIAGFRADFLASSLLEILRSRLDGALKGILKFENVTQQQVKGSHALLVTIDTKKLIPALSDFHVIDVQLRDHEILLKAERSSLIPLKEAQN